LRVNALSGLAMCNANIDGIARLNSLCDYLEGTRASFRPGLHLEIGQALIRKIRKSGIREPIRLGCKRRILEKTCRRDLVSDGMLHAYEILIRDYESMRK